MKAASKPAKKIQCMGGWSVVCLFFLALNFDDKLVPPLLFIVPIIG